MKRFLILILLVLQAGFISAQQPIGTYDREQDMTIKNQTGTPQWMIEVSEVLGDFFKKLNPEGYTDGPFTNFFTFLASAFAIFLLHLFYTKVKYRRVRRGKDTNKVIYRYRFFMIGFAICLTLSMFGKSFLWGAASVVMNFFVVSLCHGMFVGGLCPHCCSHGKIKTTEKPQGEVCNEIYGLKTYTSQYLLPSEITPECFPEGGYKIYLVKKYSYTYHCTKCNAKWEGEGWKRIQEITLS